MKHTRALLLGIVLITLLMASGCTRTNNRQDTVNYLTGTQGVEMSFLPDLPPRVLYEGDRFEAVIELRNMGTFPERGAPEGRLYISGFDENAINGLWEDFDQFPEELPGKGPVNPLGGHARKIYRDRDVRVPFDNDRYTAPIQVTSCYKYRTEATPVVCIDPEPGNRIPDKPCRPQIVTMGGGQGAPVAITKIEPRISNDGLYFTIYLSNAGRGKVISRTAYTKCPFNLDYNDINKVLVQAELPFDSAPECSPAGTAYEPVILSNSGTGAITCRFNNPGGDAYTTPLRITVDYVYSSSIKQNIEILNLDYLR